MHAETPGRLALAMATVGWLCWLSGCGAEKSAPNPPSTAPQTAGPEQTREPSDAATPPSTEDSSGDEPAADQSTTVPPDEDPPVTPADSPPRAAPAAADAAPDAPPARKKFTLATKHDEPPAPVKPLFDGWPEPQLALVLSGDMRGYVEPCGCSLNQLGGLSRRADLFRQLQVRGWPTAAFDTGGLVNNPARRQAKLKLKMALDALQELQYGGIALGAEELRIGIDLLQYMAEERPPFLACNLVLFGSPEIGVHVPQLVVTAGGVKIGVTAVFGDSHRAQVAPDGANPDVEFLDPVESLRKALAALEAEQPDLLVLLAHARVEESTAYAREFPQFHLVVSAGGPEDPDPKPRWLDKTLLVLPGQKGKHVAVVGYYPDDAEHSLRYDVVALDGKRFQDTPTMRDHMRRYQEALAVQNLVAGEPAIEDPRNATLADANPYVGAKVCGECHTRAFAKWEKTGHAKATQSLKTGRHGQEEHWVDRMQDPECIACHVTGWQVKDNYYRFRTGYESEQASGHLLGQQCENCHGPGGRHVDLERQFAKDGNETDELQKFRDFVQVLVDEAADRVCLHCHDGDNDPHFKTDGEVFEAYWKEVQHLGRD